MILAYAILLVVCIAIAGFIGWYIYNNIDKDPSLIVAAMAIPLLFLMYFLTYQLISDVKEDQACEKLGGEIVNELCLDIRQAPVLVVTK